MLSRDIEKISRPRDNKTIFGLNLTGHDKLTEHEIYHAHKCKNANNVIIFTFMSMKYITSESFKKEQFFFRHFSFWTVEISSY